MKKATSTTIFVMVIVAVVLAVLVAFILNWTREPKTLGPVFLVASAAEVEDDQANEEKTGEGYSHSENTSTSTGKPAGNQAAIPEAGDVDGVTGKTVKSVEKVSESKFTVNGKEAYTVTYKITYTDGTSCVRGISATSITSDDFNFDTSEPEAQPDANKPTLLTGFRKLSEILARSLDTIHKRMDLLLASKPFGK